MKRIPIRNDLDELINRLESLRDSTVHNLSGRVDDAINFAESMREPWLGAWERAEKAEALLTELAKEPHP